MKTNLLQLFLKGMFFKTLLFISLTAQGTTYYSRVTGNWTTAGTWSKIACGGSASTTCPGSGGSTTGASTDTVVICAGHTVTFNSSITGAVTIRNLTVNSTSTLAMSCNHTLKIYSLVLNGTINGNDNKNIEIGSAAGQTLSGTGYYSMTNSSSSLKVKNNLTILAGTDLKFNNNATFNLNNLTVTNNGKIQILNPSNFSGGSSSNFINNASTAYLVYNKGSNFPGIILTTTASGNTVEYSTTSGGASINLDNTGSYYHLVITGGTTIKKLNAATVTIAGNLTINSGATMDANTKNIDIKGNWVNNLGGAFTCSTGLVTFKATANNQTIYPPSGATGETFYNLTINNTNTNGSVTAAGNMRITSAKTLTMTSGIFDMATYTFGQTGAANLTMTGGDLRIAKLSTTVPELTGTYNITGGTITFNGTGSQTIRSLNASPANYYNIALSGSGTKTLAGAITVKGTWTNSGTTLAGNFSVSFRGSVTQNITNASGETFYGLTVNNTNGIKLMSTTDITVTNNLIMTLGNVDLNNRLLKLGNGASASLSRASGIAFNGSFKRWFPAGSITSSSGSYYGLFPIGLSTDYRPLEINTTSNTTTAGYVTVSHYDAPDVLDQTYTDNEGHSIQRITDILDSVSTSTNLGGTFSVYMSCTTLSPLGVLTDIKQELFTGGSMGSVGATIATSGTLTNPTVKRGGLSSAQLNNNFCIGTKNSTATPLRYCYYSRRSGNINDATAGNSTWSRSIGGTSCNCVPEASAVLYVMNTHTVTVNVASGANFITVNNGGTMNGTANMSVAYDVTTAGTGKITPTSGTWTIARNFFIRGTSTSTSGAVISITGQMYIDSANSLNMSANLTASDDVSIDGTLTMTSGTLLLNGLATTIEGSGGAATIAAGAGTITITNDKMIASGSDLTIQPVTTISANTIITNQGEVTFTGNLVGSHATTTIWSNDVNSVLNAGGSVLTTGVLGVSLATNLVNYNGSGAQTIKVPNGSDYSKLTISNAGTKTLAGSVVVDNLLTIEDNAILDASTFTLNGVGDLTMTDNSELKIGKLGGGTFPELTGAYTMTGGTVTLNQASGGNVYTLQNQNFYNVKFQATGSEKYNFGATTAIQNNLDVILGSTAYFANDNGALTVGGIMTMNCASVTTNNLTNPLTVGGFTLTAGRINDGGYTIALTDTGGWKKNGGIYNTTGGVLFNGSVNQTLGGSQTTTFNNVEINNSGPLGVVLAKAESINGILTFTNGNFVTTSTFLITMASGSTVTGASDDSYVNGPIAKVGNTGFTFPVGKDGEYRPIGVSTLSASGTFQAEYIHVNPHPTYSILSKDVGIAHVGSCEYWNLTRTAGVQTAYVTLSWSDFSCGVSVLSTLRVVKWDGTKWANTGNTSTTGDTISGTILGSSLVSVFGPFNLASNNHEDNALPLKLLSFDAKKGGSVVNLTWGTAMEVNNALFTVEKSQDNVNFSRVLSTPGAGTSESTLYYSAVDDNPYRGISYYRLKETDTEGNNTYSKVAAVDFDFTSEQTLDIFPNPVSASSSMNIVLKGFNSEPVEVKLIDISGKEFAKNTLVPDEDTFGISLMTTSNFAPGLYVFSAKSGNKVFTKKVIIQ